GSVSYAGETYKPVILGFSADFMTDTLGLVVSEGASFGEAEIRARSKVAVIGRKVAVELFGNNNPIGEQIQIKNNKFRVIGLFEKRGQVVFFDVDELVLVPYSTAQTYLSGNDYYTQIIARAVSPEKVDGVVYDIKRTLRDLHKIDDPEKDDFYVQTQQGLVEQVESIIGVFTLFLSLVVAVSLVVGGVGIMNIMLVSVTERTKEIGLRKAVGATSKDIMLQFLTEAVILTFAGGLIGVIIGVSLSFMVSVLAKLIAGFALSFVFPIVPALVGIFVSVLVGVVFGIYPAREASKKSPIEALRYE
ncbi:ABC transporter permease, partial [Candidatus Pacearchaeota archaeon]|nr:ABC transporter permease [Candidatus Pacearchaeota archaeon]